MRQACDLTAGMKYAFFVVTMAGVLVLAGCESEKPFEVTGVVPASQMREDAAPKARRVEPLVVKAPQRDRLPEPVSQPVSKPVARPVPKPVAKPAPKGQPAVRPATATFPDPAQPTKVTLVPDTGLVGKVASVNASLHFVVLNFPAGRMAAVEQTLVLYRQGQKIGEVKVTGPQQDDNIIADISSGEAETGDEVREK